MQSSLSAGTNRSYDLTAATAGLRQRNRNACTSRFSTKRPAYTRPKACHSPKTRCAISFEPSNRIPLSRYSRITALSDAVTTVWFTRAMTRAHVVTRSQRSTGRLSPTLLRLGGPIGQIVRSGLEQPAASNPQPPRSSSAPTGTSMVNKSRLHWIDDSARDNDNSHTRRLDRRPFSTPHSPTPTRDSTGRRHYVREDVETRTRQAVPHTLARTRKSNSALLAPGHSPMTHTLPSHLLTQTVRVAVVGGGGSGSAIAAGLPLLHQAMLASVIPAHPRHLDRRRFAVTNQLCSGSRFMPAKSAIRRLRY